MWIFVKCLLSWNCEIYLFVFCVWWELCIESRPEIMHGSSPLKKGVPEYLSPISVIFLDNFHVIFTNFPKKGVFQNWTSLWICQWKYWNNRYENEIHENITVHVIDYDFILQDVGTETSHPIRLYSRYIDNIHLYFR